MATTASMIDARRQDAQRGMPACIAGMVAQQEQLRCNSGAKGFQIADVVDGGGFATLLKGQLLTASPPTSQVCVCMLSTGPGSPQHSCRTGQAGCPAGVLLPSTQIAAAKIAVDMSTDDEGKLTDHQRRSYQAGMRHEREIYERLSHGTNNGIPTVYFAGAVRHQAAALAGIMCPSAVKRGSLASSSCSLRIRPRICANLAGAIKKGGDSNHPSKLHFLSFMVMELLGPSVGQLSLELQTYKNNLRLLVNHGLGMLKVGQSMRKGCLTHLTGWQQ